MPNMLPRERAEQILSEHAAGKTVRSADGLKQTRQAQPVASVRAYCLVRFGTAPPCLLFSTFAAGDSCADRQSFPRSNPI